MIKSSEELALPQIKTHPFEIRTLKDVASQELEPTKQLIGSLIYPEEQTILFGGTGIGKSILAMQIAISISKGEDLNLDNGVYLKNECKPIKVIYFDFELSQRQLQHRISQDIDVIDVFMAYVERGKYVDSDPKTVFESLKAGAESKGTKCIIIDNISAISNDLEKSENAKVFMHQLWMLARDDKYTIIVLAHTPKIKEFEGLSINHLKGSSVLGQLADAVIGMGKTKDNKGVYIKQIKTRNGSIRYGEENVIHTQIIKENNNVLHKGVGLANEIELLNNVSVDLGYTNHRMLFVYAYLYYGSYRKAESELKEMLIDSCSMGNIKHHVDAFKDSDSKTYKELAEKSDDELKKLLEYENPGEGFFPKRDDHISNEDLPL